MLQLIYDRTRIGRLPECQALFDELQHGRGQFFRKLNQFFSDRVNSMESISMDFRRGFWESPLLQDGLENFWNLRSLRVLKLDCYDLTFNDVSTISNSFPILQVLRLVTWQLDDGCISTLSKLKNLTDLDLFAWNGFCDVDIYEFVFKSEAEGLRRFEITNGQFCLRLVMDIINRFPRLKNLVVRRLLQENSSCSALSNLVVRRLLQENSSCSALSNLAKQLRRKFSQRDMKIVLFAENEWLSESRRVRRAIEKLRRAAAGDERRPRLKLDMQHESDYSGFIQSAGERSEKRFVRMYHRFFC